MANFKISLPEHLFLTLLEDAMSVQAARAQETLPPYPIFVNRLMKGMETPAQELHHACTGMSGEAGEILDVSKKVWVYNKPLDIPHLIEELGDLRFYYQAALNLLGITDEQVKAQNVLKLQKRYTEGVYSDKEANERKDKQPQGLSATGSKGTATPEPRKFMGKDSTESNSADYKDPA